MPNQPLTNPKPNIMGTLFYILSATSFMGAIYEMIEDYDRRYDINHTQKIEI